MLRSIESFRTDEQGDWIAELVCGHAQHVRHKPPLVTRPWVLTAEGRASRIGQPLECVLCDRFELPVGHVSYKKTFELDEDTLPAGLRRDHTTRAGVWAIIHVIAGQLRYIVEPPLASERVLDRDHPGIVVPEVRHRVEPIGPVRCYVEFFRRPK